MVERRTVGVALLAAGASRRFGVNDKLAAELGGVPLGQHAAMAFPLAEVSAAWVIVAARGHSCEPGWEALGFKPVVNPAAAEGMGTSVALAARLAMREGLDALAIALADMPLVPGEHHCALIEAVSGPSDIAVSATGDARMPPAVFGSAHFEVLARLTGDKGARDLLRSGRIVACPPEWLADVDTAEALAAIRRSSDEG